MKSRFDMCGSSVTLDLVAINNVLAAAVADALENLNQELATIRECLSDAHSAKYNGDEHENYRRLCNANTHREWLMNKAQRLSDAIEAHYHVNEATKRDQCPIIKC